MKEKEKAEIMSAFKNKQLNVSELARVCDLSRTTVYKYLNLLESKVS